MKFEKVRKKHILLAIEDYKKKGLPKGFGPSSTYDIVYKEEIYPPKAIMAYANYHASGKEITGYFKGGQGTDCFNVLEQEGFIVQQKSNKLLETYLKEFSSIADDWFQRQDWFQETFDFYINFFKENNIKNAEWDDFQELGKYIHAFKSMAIAKGNALGKPNLPIEEYRRIFSYIASEEDPINITINNLYKKYEGSAVLPYFSNSSISEIIAYAFPNKYVVYNRRSVKALEILGINVTKVRAEKFGDTFKRYNGILTSVLEQYKEIVRQRTNTTIQLELDQFFSWLYETKKADKPIKELIHRYKALIKSDGIDAEKYKWEFIRDFKGRPNLDNNIADELQAIKFSNLIYHLSISCLKVIANFDAASLKQVFISIQNETIDLDKRVADFSKNTLKIYKKAGGENSHHQDERSISVYLTLNDPSEYTFYKNSYYIEYCKLLNVKPAKTKNKYSHYLELIKDLTENYISKDKELVKLMHSELGDLMEQDPAFLLLAQDILYQIVGNDRDCNYWVFQGNPDHYDFENAIKDEENTIKTWRVVAHRDKIKVGDKVILWISGEKAGCYALCEITREPFAYSKKDNNYWSKTEDKSIPKTCFEITHNLAHNPITREQVKSYKALKDLNVSIQGTNFQATKEEYDQLLSMINNNSTQMIKNIPLNQILCGPPGTGKTYNTVNKALELIGQNIEGKKRKEIKDMFKTKVDEGQIVFTTFHQSFSYEDFIEGIKPVINDEELNIDGEIKYSIEDGVFKDFVQQINDKMPLENPAHSRINIDLELFNKPINKVSLGNSLNQEDGEIFQYCVDNECIAIGFGEDIDFSGVKSRFDIRKKYKNSGIEISNPMDFNISAIERLVIWMEEGQLVFISNGNRKLRAIGVVDGDYFFDNNTPIRYHQFRKVKWLYTDLDIPIKEIYGKNFSQQTIYQISHKEINKEFFNLKALDVASEKKYVLIIDEINRGNVSQIFGELITLLEEDKRKGNKEEMSVILPYSKKPFSVPNNLYILGTMNTADRSAEALDTALRRRFSFEEMLPEPEKLKETIEGVKLSELLTALNDRIEVLVDRDHTVGHAFFMELHTLDDLRATFANKIIPLLQEYFYGDYGKMEMVIGSAFFKVKDTTKVKFAIKSEDFDPEGKVYQIKDVLDKKRMSDEVFKEAITKLIKGHLE